MKKMETRDLGVAENHFKGRLEWAERKEFGA